MNCTQDEIAPAQVSIAELREGENVNAFELGYFLYYFRAAYVVCLERIQYQSITLEEAKSLGRVELLDLLDPLLHTSVTSLWLYELPEELDLEFITISKESPLKFVAKSAGISLIALTMAVIISGGKANVYEGTFDIPPMANGIRALMNAFGVQSPNALPSERRTQENDFLSSSSS